MLADLLATACLILVPEGLSGLAYAEMSVVVLIGACLQGIGGIGFAMFSAPIAGLFFPQMAPGPLLVLGGAVSLLSALREHQAIDWPMAVVTLLGRFVGAALAVAAIAVMSPKLLSIAFALMILVAVGMILAGWVLPPTRSNACGAGLVSGVMGTITSAGAPPFAILMQRMDPARFRATIGCILGAGAAVSLLMLASVGKFGLAQLHLGLALLPWTLLGFAASSTLGRHISSRTVRATLLGMAAAGAAGILIKAAL